MGTSPARLTCFGSAGTARPFSRMRLNVACGFFARAGVVEELGVDPAFALANEAFSFASAARCSSFLATSSTLVFPSSRLCRLGSGSRLRNEGWSSLRRAFSSSGDKEDVEGSQGHECEDGEACWPQKLAEQCGQVLGRKSSALHDGSEQCAPSSAGGADDMRETTDEEWSSRAWHPRALSLVLGALQRS